MINYREMASQDYPSVMALWSQTEAMRLRDADSAHNIERYLARNPGLSFVAFEQDTLVGAVLVGSDGRRGYLQHLAVAETHRGQRIGQSLVELATRALARQGIAKTHLFVFDHNVRAQAFYQRLGWVERDDVKMYSFNSSSHDNV